MSELASASPSPSYQITWLSIQQGLIVVAGSIFLKGEDLFLLLLLYLSIQEQEMVQFALGRAAHPIIHQTPKKVRSYPSRCNP